MVGRLEVNTQKRANPRRNAALRPWNCVHAFGSDPTVLPAQPLVRELHVEMECLFFLYQHPLLRSAL
jgi:hypothetical protein